MYLQSIPLFKYPRTPHLEGSRLQAGDDGSDQVSLKSLEGQFVVIEEKLDGANCAVSFSEAGELLLQSRGHYLMGGASERQFNLLKQWAVCHEDALLRVLEDRYVLFGEWTFAKHSVWYDALPHHFHEFDVYDRQKGIFLSTAARKQLLADLPVLSVPVLYEGPLPQKLSLIKALVRPSLGKTPSWKQAFEQHVAQEQLPLPLTWQQTDKSNFAEGLYLKAEVEDRVVGRYKWVRKDFVQTILDSGSHHSRRPILPNLLIPGADVFSSVLTHNWSDLGLKTLRGLDSLVAFSKGEGDGN